MKRFYLLLFAGLLLLNGCKLLEKSNQAEGQDVSGNLLNNVLSKESLNNKKVTVNNKLVINLYYQDKNGYLIPVSRRIEKQEGIAKAAISGLIEGPATREKIEKFGLLPVLPEGTEVLGINIKNGIAVVDFNEKLLSYKTEKEEKNIISSVVYTLTGFASIKKVNLMVAGKVKGQLKYKKIPLYMDRSNTLINSNQNGLKQGFEKLDIYLYKVQNNDYYYILPVSILVNDFDTKSLPDKIIGNMVNGNYEKGLITQLPRKLVLKSYKIVNNTLFLDFNRALLEIGGNSREEGIVNQILYSAGQIKGVEKVKISVEGVSEYLTEGTDISSEVDIPRQINDYIDKE